MKWNWRSTCSRRGCVSVFICANVSIFIINYREPACLEWLCNANTFVLWYGLCGTQFTCTNGRGRERGGESGRGIWSNTTLISIFSMQNLTENNNQAHGNSRVEYLRFSKNENNNILFCLPNFILWRLRWTERQIYNQPIMECDVIQDCTLDVDPLATVEQCVDIDGNITSIYQDSMNDPISDSNESISLLENSHTSPATDVATTTSKHIYESSYSENNDNCNNSNSLSNITFIKSGEINYHYYPHHSKASKVRSKVLKRHHQALRNTPPRIIVKPPTLLSTTSQATHNKQHSMANASKSDYRELSGSRATNESMESTSKLATSVQSSIKTSVGMATSLRKLTTSAANALQHGPSTMREVLASIPGFSIKTRRRGNKKMSTAAQIEQTREGCIDLETPDSILVSTNLRDLLNKETFCLLPPLYQYKLVQLLPGVDQDAIELDNGTKRQNSSLTNEFFARACLEWRERLAEGEFTPENQLKLRAEAEKEKCKLDPWKVKHFEPIWGEKIRLKRNNRFVSPQLMSSSSLSGGGSAAVTPSTSKQLNLVSKSLSSTTHSSIGSSSQSQLPSSFASEKHATTTATSAATTVTTSLSGLREAAAVSRKPTLGNRKLLLSDRPSLKTTIKLRPTTSIANSTIPLTPHNYTTSSGRIVKSPNNVYASGSANVTQHKRTRTGAVTRSSLATTTTNSASPELNNQMKVSVVAFLSRRKRIIIYFTCHLFVDRHRNESRN